MNRLQEKFVIEKWPATSNPLHNATVMLERTKELQSGTLEYADKDNFFKDPEFPMIAFRLISGKLEYNDDDEEKENDEDDDDDDDEEKESDEDNNDDDEEKESDEDKNDDEDYDDEEKESDEDNKNNNVDWTEYDNDLTDISDLESVKDSILKDLEDNQIRALLGMAKKMQMLNLKKMHVESNDESTIVSSLSTVITNKNDDSDDIDTQRLKKLKI